MRSFLAVVMAIASMPLLADEPTSWSTAERDAAIRGCAHGIAEPAYDDYRKRNNLPAPDPEMRLKAIELAMATDGPIWSMCTCVMDEVAKLWKPIELQAHQSEYQALALELANGKCKPDP